MPTTEQLTAAANEYALTGNQSAAARAAGLPRTTTMYHLQREEIQTLIRDCQLKLVQKGLAKSVENQLSKIDASQEITTKIRQGQELSDGSIKLLELGHDSEKQLLQSVGVHNSHTQSITLNQIMIDARSEMSPAVEALLVRHFTEDVQEAEVVDNS